MYKILANILSIVFHPLLMATILIGILFLFAPTALSPISSASILPILTMIFVWTYAVPLLSIGILKFTSSIQSFKMEQRSERITPFFFITIFYAIISVLFATKLVISDTLIVIFVAITLILLLVSIITTVYKISAHATGISGLTGFMLAFQIKFPGNMLFYPILIALLLWGMLSSARLVLNQHSPREIYLGSVLGFVISFGAVYFFL